MATQQKKTLKRLVVGEEFKFNVPSFDGLRLRAGGDEANIGNVLFSRHQNNNLNEFKRTVFQVVNKTKTGVRVAFKAFGHRKAEKKQVCEATLRTDRIPKSTKVEIEVV